MLIPWHVLRGLRFGTDPGQGAASVSVPAAVTHGLAGSSDNNGVASPITDGRQMTSIKDETSSFVLSDELPDWLADLVVGVLLPSFFMEASVVFLVKGINRWRVLERASV
jgi:hypothetical protein